MIFLNILQEVYMFKRIIFLFLCSFLLYMSSFLVLKSSASSYQVVYLELGCGDDILEIEDCVIISGVVDTNCIGEYDVYYFYDEDFDIMLTYDVRERVPGIYGYLGIHRTHDQQVVLVSDTNDRILNKFESLPMGVSKVRLHFPKRLLVPDTYVIRLDLASRLAIQFVCDSQPTCLKFELNDYTTKRGNRRRGYFSTIIDWEIMNS